MRSFGGPDRIRTDDPHNANVMRSQLRYRPITIELYFSDYILSMDECAFCRWIPVLFIGFHLLILLKYAIMMSLLLLGVYGMKRIFHILLAFALTVVLFSLIPVEAEAAAMTSSDAMLNVLKRMEGFYPYPYEDGQQWSVGYGSRCPDDKLAEYQTNGISEAEAHQLLMNMLSNFEKSVNNYAWTYNLALTQNQFDALVCFTYNCGAGWMSEVDGNFNKAVREGKRGSEFIYSICLWSKASGQHILMNRRMSEAYMYLEGVYEAYNDTSDGSYPDSYRYVFLDGNGGTSRYGIHGYHTDDPSAIITDFSMVPTAVNSAGETYNLTFDGWYTEQIGGTKVQVLDGSVNKGITLYAHWKDENGQIVTNTYGALCQPQQVTVNTSLNVRKGPGTNYESLYKLNNGDVITITQIYATSSILWGKFDNGWVSLEYTSYFQSPIPRTGKVNATDVNVRTGPSTSYPSVGKVSTGTPVTIYEYAADNGLVWGKMGDGNWIAIKYVTLDPYVPDPPPEPEPIRGDFDDNGSVNVDDVIALLLHVSMPDVFEISGPGDLDNSGKTDVDDVIHLLLHVSMPDLFPL